jgi:hypothetical protein
MFPPADFTKLQVFLSSAMRSDRAMALRRTIRLIGNRQNLFKIDVIEDAAAMPNLDNLMRFHLRKADLVVVVLLDHDEEYNGYLIPQGVQTELNGCIRLKKPTLVLVEERLAQKPEAKATMDYLYTKFPDQYSFGWVQKWNGEDAAVAQIEASLYKHLRICVEMYAEQLEHAQDEPLGTSSIQVTR